MVPEGALERTPMVLVACSTKPSPEATCQPVVLPRWVSRMYMEVLELPTTTPICSAMDWLPLARWLTFHAT